MTALPGAVSLESGGRASPGSYVRFILVPLWTTLWLVPALLLRIVPASEAAGRWIIRAWARGLLRILRIDLVREGTAPTPPFLLVSNHLSYLDIIVLASQADCLFVAKREVRSWPIFGWGARVMDCIFVDRDSRADTVRAGDAMRERYRAGKGVVLFAEGTSSEGSTVLPLRSSLLEWPARDLLPVHTALLSYHTAAGDPPAGLSLCWWGDMTFTPHLLGVCRLGPSQARVRFHPSPVSSADRKMLAAALHSSLLADFRPSGTG